MVLQQSLPTKKCEKCGQEDCGSVKATQRKECDCWTGLRDLAQDPKHRCQECDCCSVEETVDGLCWVCRLKQRKKPITEDQIIIAFNKWMDEYTNHPERFSRHWQSVCQHLEEKRQGEEITYGARATATLLDYMRSPVDDK